jgi:hypothetical protein
MDNIQLYIPIIVSCIAVIPGVLALLFGMRKEKEIVLKTQEENKKIAAERADELTDIAIKLVDPLKKRINDLEMNDLEKDKKITRLERIIKAYASRMQELLNGINILSKQLVDSYIEPAWKPDVWDVYDICDGDDGYDKGI